MRHIAVIDIGKTNAKLAMVDLSTLTELDVVTRANSVIPGPPWPSFDTEGHWAFLLNGLRDFHSRHGIDGISITTHGACATLLGSDGGLAAPILDYEHVGPDQMARDYDALRPTFSQTGSPRLPGGLNIGAQLFWQFRTDPTLFDRVETIVTYPQYWAHRLTGVAAIDVTSIGCHTDLWNPTKATFSSLVESLGIGDKLAPVRRSDRCLGPILPDIERRTGLRSGTPVLCGIHDSNASLFAHITRRKSPFSVVSTGTWVIVMAVGGLPPTLDPARDSLLNVNALGQPVPSARFMGGREFELLQQGAPSSATEADVDQVLARNLMLFPAVDPHSGPFQGVEMHWHPSEPAPSTGPRHVAVSYYLALVSAECLSITGAQGDIIVEGPFAKNPHFQTMLSAATGRDVVASHSATGTSIGAAMLFQTHQRAPGGDDLARCSPSDLAQLTAYAARWRHHVGRMVAPGSTHI